MSSTEVFIIKAKAIHGEKYNYSKVEYVNARQKIDIVCKEHGDFEQTPNNHLTGYGCIKCGSRSREISFEDFVNISNKLHINKLLENNRIYYYEFH